MITALGCRRRARCYAAQITARYLAAEVAAGRPGRGDLALLEATG